MNYRYLDRVDLPSDTNGVLGKLRGTLAMTYNGCREVPSRMQLLKQTLRFVLTLIEIGEGSRADVPEVPQRVSLEDMAELNQGIITSTRLTRGFTKPRKRKPTTRKAAKSTKR